MKTKNFLIVLFIVMMLSVSFLSGQKAVVMEEVLKPSVIAMDDNQIYITDSQTNVLIFNKKDFKFIKKFGKKGEGPREFMAVPGLPIAVTPLKDKLLVNSFGKISFFSKKGIYINEIKNPTGAAGSFGYIPVNDGYIAQGRAGGSDGLYSTISFFDEKLKIIKELYRIKIGKKGLSKIDVLNANVPYQAYKDKIFVTGEKGFLVNVLNNKGEIAFKIERKDYKAGKVSEKFIKQIHKTIEKQSPQQYAFLKDRMVFPKYFPSFSSFYIDAKVKMLYLFTWKIEGGIIECFIYDMDGKFQKRMDLSIEMQGSLQPYPMTIYNWKLYQLIDNDETENWEMHITDIKK